MFKTERAALNGTLAEAKLAIAKADIDGANKAIAKASNLLDSFTDIADDINETELVKDLDAAVEEIPAQFKALAQAGLGAIKHFIRVGTRASNTLQQAERTLDRAEKLLTAIHEKGFKVAIPE